MPDPTEINATDNPPAQHANRCFFMPVPTTILKGSESKLFVLSDTSNIDLRMSDTYYKNITENTAFTFSNKPRSNMTKIVRVIVDRASDYTVTWPNDVTWKGDSAPELKLGTNIFEFMIYNNKIVGSLINDDSGSGAAASAANAETADKVNHAFTLKLNSGTMEGRTQYTFDGSANKTLDLKPGTNISMTSYNGSTTINGVAPSLKVGMLNGTVPTLYQSASPNGETTIRLMSGTTVNDYARIYGDNGIEVTTIKDYNDILITNTDITRCYPLAKSAIAEIVNNRTLVDKSFVTGEHGALTIEFHSSQYSDELGSEKYLIKIEQRDFTLYSNIEYEITPSYNNTSSYRHYTDTEALLSGEFDFEDEHIDGISVKLHSDGYDATGEGMVTFSTVGSTYPDCSNSIYSTWNYVVDNVYDGTPTSMEYTEAWNTIEFDPSTLSNDGDEVTIYLNYKHIGGGGSDSSEDITELQTVPTCRLRIRREANGKYRFFVNYIVTETNNVDFEEISSKVKVVKYADANALKEIINLINAH